MSVIPVILKTNDGVLLAFYAVVSLENYSLIKKNISKVLHPGEMSYFNTLKYERRQKSYLMGRYVCKKALISYFNETNMAAIEIVQGIFGQPTVRYLTREMPGISLSHDDSIAAAIAFPDTHPMAVDIENATESKVEVIKSQLTDDEVKFAMSGILPEYLLCTLFWTAKEALSKLLKSGLAIRFAFLETEIIENNCGQEFHIIFKNFPQYQARVWIIENTVLAIGYPKKTEISLNYKEIRSCLYEKHININNKAVSTSHG